MRVFTYAWIDSTTLNQLASANSSQKYLTLDGGHALVCLVDRFTQRDKMAIYFSPPSSTASPNERKHEDH